MRTVKGNSSPHKNWSSVSVGLVIGSSLVTMAHRCQHQSQSLRRQRLSFTDNPASSGIASASTNTPIPNQGPD